MSLSAQTALTTKLIVSIAFTLAILLGAFTVLAPFILAVIWAAIIAIASWPLHEFVTEKLAPRKALADWTTTLLVLVFIVGPMTLMIFFVAQDVYQAVDYLTEADKFGAPVPPLLSKVPLVSDQLVFYWEQYLSKPAQLSKVLEAQGGFLRNLGQGIFFDLTSRVATLFFALWILFFFYRDGLKISTWVNQIGYKWLERRWPSYVFQLPSALRATVNGIVIVALAEAILLSVMLWLTGMPSPVTFGVVTALIAFIPLAAPLLLAGLGFFLYASGSQEAGFVVFFLGNAIVLAADYAVRPVLMKGGTELPFLAILFGIFGGAATMGIVGLIIGPVLLVLLAVLFREAALDEHTVDLDLTSTQIMKRLDLSGSSKDDL